ncbi:MAG TPA: thiol reductase thioredoxin, partial [Ramlibacter sp.]|nr:thiol reductase thioredoxin [Ramlibacter sp.]
MSAPTTSSSAVHVVCPHCHTTNRVQRGQLASAPDCGSCHQPLFAGQPANLDEAAFERHVGRSGIPVLVDF